MQKASKKTKVVSKQSLFCRSARSCTESSYRGHHPTAEVVHITGKDGVMTASYSSSFKQIDVAG